ncbi:MAG TPA: PIN domain-containing protein [Candidatus Nanoarchaeia archaeon]|nr:PIN domain-containing protein [Candidatus Nanoarchaeia archaeon]
MTDSKLIDSSVWLEYLIHGKYKDLFETKEILHLSVLSLFEIKRKLIRDKFNANEIITALEFIKKRMLIAPVSAEISNKAVELSLQYKLGAMDALIYASAALHPAVLITCDNDFRKLPEVTILS